SQAPEAPQPVPGAAALADAAAAGAAPSQAPARGPTSAATQSQTPAQQAPVPVKQAPWTIAVMSDIHMPRRNLKVEPELPRAVAAIVGLRPRLVVITGDHTNGGDKDSPATVARSARWWKIFADELRPLRDAGIPVLPVAGNHDAYLAGQRAHYAAAFADLAAWAAPLALNAAVPAGGKVMLDRPPFSYSVDVDGVHLSLAHVVTQGLHREVAAWLADDLARAAGAKLRLVFGHVPMSSVIAAPSGGFVRALGGLLEAGRAAVYVAGHEHLVWDEDVRLPGGGSVRQVLVGCTSALYNWAPSAASRQRAGCMPEGRGPYPLRCRMPNGGGAFLLAPDKINAGRVIQHHRNSFTLITIDGGAVTDVVPMTVDEAGRALPFYVPAGGAQ
ncbi:MAG TPA: metallophosphoesterase, partial [Kofleriaceae bacterium]|nr:metallophosphoesterase [Kofleriaceae bacterium]